MIMTINEFIDELKIKNPRIFAEYEVVPPFKGKTFKVKLKNQFGIVEVLPTNLLKGQYINGLKSAIDKHAYFVNYVKFLHPDKFNNVVYITQYINDSEPILFKSKYGLCSRRPNLFIKGSGISIGCALNPTEYFSNQAKEIHGELYDYSLVKYKNGDTKVLLQCKKSHIFKQTPASHLRGSGCPICGIEKIKLYNQENYLKWSYKGWEELGLKSKNFDSFKVYIIKCWNDEEVFFKIGKTYLTIKNRFSSKQAMPYRWEIAKLITGSSLEISSLESKLKNKNKIHKYIPKSEFCGMYECFSQIQYYE